MGNMDTSTIDKLFLELSQVTQATTEKERRQRKELAFAQRVIRDLRSQLKQAEDRLSAAGVKGSFDRFTGEWTGPPSAEDVAEQAEEEILKAERRGWERAIEAAIGYAMDQPGTPISAEDMRFALPFEGETDE